MNFRRLFRKIYKVATGDGRVLASPPDGAVGLLLSKAMVASEFDSAENKHSDNGRTKRFPNLYSAAPGSGATETTKIRRRLKDQAQERWVFSVSSGQDRGRQFVGVTKEIRIGRQPENHIQLRDPKVSRFHAMIHRKGSQLYLEDLQSTNGTFLNDQLLHEKKRLFPGDRIKLGQTVIEVLQERRLEK